MADDINLPNESGIVDPRLRDPAQRHRDNAAKQFHIGAQRRAVEHKQERRTTRMRQMIDTFRAFRSGRR